MVRFRVLLVGCLLCLLLVFSGCQTQQQVVEPVEEVERLVPAVPSTRGPTGPPEIKGPTSPPPLSSDDETVHVTLPEDPDFKY